MVYIDINVDVDVDDFMFQTGVLLDKQDNSCEQQHLQVIISNPLFAFQSYSITESSPIQFLIDLYNSYWNPLIFTGYGILLIKVGVAY